MKRANTNEEKKGTTFVVIVDDQVASYIEQQGITDTNAYMNRLLRDEMQCQLAHPEGRKPNRLVESTPDTSGYPEMQGNFQK
ncbi:MAG TPA: hypothetical protein V6C52_04675 [Coleofasciculaceae cyanobacterium]|jgi:hypothetical protein